MNLKFWRKRETKDDEGQKEEKQEEDVNTYLVIAVNEIRGGLSFSTPTVFGMRPFLDNLEKLPSFNATKSGDIIYRPIGILYEATIIEKEKKEP